jgi:hypothetical protein
MWYIYTISIQNDKTDIDGDKFIVVNEDPSIFFGGCSVDENSLINSRWINPDTNDSMDDKLRTYQIVCEKM